jgi:D-3-phosphoglycerate dehydrogenase
MKVVITDYLFEDLQPEIDALRGVAEVVAFRDYPGPERLLEVARDAEGLVSQATHIPAEIIDQLQNCRILARYGVGYDLIDVEAATRRGIPVCNVPDYCTDEVADHTLALALTLLRKVPVTLEYLRGGGWNQNPLRPIRRLSSLTYGVYGFGRIGRAVAQRAKSFGFQVIACDPHVDDAAFAEAGVERVDAHGILTRSDLLSLHMLLNRETRHLMNDETLALMKRDACLVNTARGAIVDTEALERALAREHLQAVALDVLEVEPIAADNPLWRFPNVWMTPHIAWYSEESLRQLQRQIGEECARVLRGEAPRNAVNPEYRTAERSSR